ncbi:MAG TPA: hypothetical protein VHC72_09670 [Bryobacteraceae bacterium]|nr:hypothetical protein [Bryobacteraceae bacterium]
MSRSDQILEGLKVDLDRAQKDLEAAQLALRSIASDPRQLPRIPTGRPQPEGCELIREAFRAEREARERYLEALHRFNHFAIYR